MSKAKLKFLIFLLAFPFVIKGQVNLVPNPSFEQYDTCPNNGGQIHYATYWSNPTLYASPDYFNSCGTFGYGTPNTNFGYENGKTGNGYAGIVTFVGCPGNPPGCVNGREYIQVQLTEALQSGIKYCVRFYVSLGDSSLFSSGNMGAYLSTTMLGIPNDSVIPFVPQINNNSLINPLTNKNGWTMVLDSFVAVGGEEFLIIGNFNYDSTTDTASTSGANWCNYSFYLIDDVLVTPSDSFNTINDPPVYSPAIKVYPNPTQGILHLISNSNDEVTLRITDSMGKEIERKLLRGTLDFTIDINMYPNGVYFLEFKSENDFFVTKIIKSD